MVSHIIQCKFLVAVSSFSSRDQRVDWSDNCLWRHVPLFSHRAYHQTLSYSTLHTIANWLSVRCYGYLSVGCLNAILQDCFRTTTHITVPCQEILSIFITWHFRATVCYTEVIKDNMQDDGGQLSHTCRGVYFFITRILHKEIFWKKGVRICAKEHLTYLKLAFKLSLPLCFPFALYLSFFISIYYLSIFPTMTWTFSFQLRSGTLRRASAGHTSSTTTTSQIKCPWLTRSWSFIQRICESVELAAFLCSSHIFFLASFHHEQHLLSSPMNRKSYFRACSCPVGKFYYAGDTFRKPAIKWMGSFLRELCAVLYNATTFQKSWEAA